MYKLLLFFSYVYFGLRIGLVHRANVDMVETIGFEIHMDLGTQYLKGILIRVKYASSSSFNLFFLMSKERSVDLVEQRVIGSINALKSQGLRSNIQLH